MNALNGQAIGSGEIGGPGAPVCIVFSKDRPLQLDATLRSLTQRCDDIDLAEVHVLFAASAPRFSAGYRILAQEHPSVTFHREADFRDDLVRLVRGSKYVLFVVDDTIFVSRCSIKTAKDVLEQEVACLGFSYRLGRNTTYCYTADSSQNLPGFSAVESRVVRYDWTVAEHDFGYPLEVSSSLYRTSDILPLLVKAQFRNPNTLETALADDADSFRETRPQLACYEQSVAFSVPANLVQSDWRNRANSDPALTADALERAFAAGMRIDITHHAGHVARACHEQVQFEYERRSDVPTVSVVIPCYGQAIYLPEAVGSVVGQTLTDWELVIVDDGSPDDTAIVAQSLMEQYPDRRIRLLRQDNTGVPSARNAGIAASKGRYILPLDADDAITPRMLEATVGLLESDPAASIAYTDWEDLGDPSQSTAMDDFDARTLPARNQFAYCALYRREVWEAVGGYSPTMALGNEDWDFWVGSVERGYEARRVPEPLFRYRIRPGSRSETARRHDAELKRQIRANHPRLYRPWLRATAATLIAIRQVELDGRAWLSRSALGPFLRRIRAQFRPASR